MVQESLCDAQYMNCCFYLDSAELNYIQEQELHNHSRNNYLLLLQVSLLGSCYIHSLHLLGNLLISCLM